MLMYLFKIFYCGVIIRQNYYLLLFYYFLSSNARHEPTDDYCFYDRDKHLAIKTYLNI